MSLLIGLMAATAVLLLFYGVRAVRAPGYEAALARFGTATASYGPRSRFNRLVRPAARVLARHVTIFRILSDDVKVQRRLDYAGNPHQLTPFEFYGLQVYGATAGLAVAFLWTLIGLPGGTLFMLALPFLGFFYPVLWLRGKARKRQAAITIALPDLLDMLAVCVSAGMGFDIALGLLSSNEEGPLYEEIRRLLRELRIGEPRDRAFRRLSERNSSVELRNFIDALLQAEDLGTPIAATLERQAEDMRTARHQRAREQGARASNNISLVTVFLIMPSILFLIFGGIALAVLTSGALEQITPQ
jgi:tight adherence protein C